MDLDFFRGFGPVNDFLVGVGIAQCIIGLGLCLAGFFFFKLSIGLIGFIIGGLICAVIGGLIGGSAMAAILGLVGAIIGFFIAWKLHRISVFIAGLLVGMVFGFGIWMMGQSGFPLNLMFNYLWEGNFGVEWGWFIVICGIPGIIFGIIALRFEEISIIITSLFIGSVLVTQGLSFAGVSGEIPAAVAMVIFGVGFMIHSNRLKVSPEKPQKEPNNKSVTYHGNYHKESPSISSYDSRNIWW